MSATFRASIYHFTHSRMVRVFFLIYLTICLLSLASTFATPLDMFTQSISDMTMPALGLSVFSGIYIGGEFKNRTIQNQISHGQKRSHLLLISFLTLLFVFWLLVYSYAALPSLIFSVQYGSFGKFITNVQLTDCTSYLLRLIFPGTLFTCARATGLFIIPFIFKDTVKTILSSVVYSLLIGTLTQTNKLAFPFKYYSPVNMPWKTDIIIVFISICVLTISFFVAYLSFRRSPLK